MAVILPNAVFIHVPRTGGMWLRRVIEQAGINALDLRGDDRAHMAWRHLPDCLRALPSFGFVRHPLTWARSRWALSRKINAHAERRFHGIHARFDKLVMPTFAETLANIIDKEAGLVGGTFDWMLEGVDKVYNYELLNYAAADVLMKFFGWRIDKAIDACTSVPPFNHVDSGDEVVPDDLVAAFAKSERAALDKWGYE